MYQPMFTPRASVHARNTVFLQKWGRTPGAFQFPLFFLTSPPHLWRIFCILVLFVLGTLGLYFLKYPYSNKSGCYRSADSFSSGSALYIGRMTSLIILSKTKMQNRYRVFLSLTQAPVQRLPGAKQTTHHAGAAGPLEEAKEVQQLRQRTCWPRWHPERLNPESTASRYEEPLHGAPLLQGKERR
jgi:hypothetical protein